VLIVRIAILIVNLTSANPVYVIYPVVCYLMPSQSVKDKHNTFSMSSIKNWIPIKNNLKTKNKQ